MRKFGNITLGPETSSTTANFPVALMITRVESMVDRRAKPAYCRNPFRTVLARGKVGIYWIASGVLSILELYSQASNVAGTVMSRLGADLTANSAIGVSSSAFLTQTAYAAINSPLNSATITLTIVPAATTWRDVVTKFGISGLDNIIRSLDDEMNDIVLNDFSAATLNIDFPDNTAAFLVAITRSVVSRGQPH